MVHEVRDPRDVYRWRCHLVIPYTLMFFSYMIMLKGKNRAIAHVCGIE